MDYPLKENFITILFYQYMGVCVNYFLLAFYLLWYKIENKLIQGGYLMSIITLKNKDDGKAWTKKHIVLIISSIIVFAVLLLLALLFLFSNKKPSDMNDTTYNYGVEALKIVDDYIDGKETKKDAYNKLNAIHDKLKEYNFTGNELKKNVIVSGEALLISSYISDSNIDKVLECRNKFANFLNKKSR